MSNLQSGSVGPFEAAEVAMQNFANNVFVSMMVTETLNNRVKLQREYDLAVETEDEAYIRQARIRLEACDMSLHVAAQLLGQEESQPA